MLILLPPSEGKAAPRKGAALRISRLSFPALNPTRTTVAHALVKLCAGPPAKARTVLGISARQDDELERNQSLLTVPTAPAGEIYTGVLYDALDIASLPKRSRTRATSDIAIASALFGLLRIDDPIPAYRLSGDATLPGVGKLATTWREVVPAAISEAADRGVILDLRSSAYVALGPVPAEASERTLVARVLQEKGVKRTIVSHHNKATKGRIVRALLARPQPRTVDGVAEALAAADYRVELAPPVKGGPWTVDVIVREL
ncbi:MAG: peroxide stress protein YaaA [Actinomycetales bacterium]|nr:peroxide stress protein YaaA [Actinomycetales bacterium]